MKKLLIVLLISFAASTVNAQHRVLSRADLGTPSVIVLSGPPYNPTLYGDPGYGSGLAIRKMPPTSSHAGHYHLYISSWKPEQVLEYELGPSAVGMPAGTAQFVQIVGSITHYGQYGGDSFFFDEDSGRLCVSSGSTYTPTNGLNTLACAELDPITGKFKTRINPTTGTTTVDSKSWGFQVCGPDGVCTNRPDRMTQSGILKVPSESMAQKLKGHYIAGFGGNYSVISNGISMGFAACAFDLPEQSFSEKIKCTPLLGYPIPGFVQVGIGKTFMNRNSDYKQVLHYDDNPEKGTDAVAKYGFGKFVPGVDGYGGMAADIVGDTFVGFGEIGRGCIAYGDNYNNDPPIVQEGAAIKPLATDLASGAVTFPSVPWDTGQMVNIISKTGSGGLRAEIYTVHFLRKIDVNQFTFHASKDIAEDPLGVAEKPTTAVTAGVQAVSYCQAPAAPYPYPKAQIGSQGKRHVIYFYDIDDLASVAAKLKPQNGIQPVSFDYLDLPGIKYPADSRPILGAQWVSELGKFFVGMRNPGGLGRRIYAYPINVWPTPPKPANLKLQEAP